MFWEEYSEAVIILMCLFDANKWLVVVHKSVIDKIGTGNTDLLANKCSLIVSVQENHLNEKWIIRFYCSLCMHILYFSLCLTSHSISFHLVNLCSYFYFIFLLLFTKAIYIAIQTSVDRPWHNTMMNVRRFYNLQFVANQRVTNYNSLAIFIIK